MQNSSLFEYNNLGYYNNKKMVETAFCYSNKILNECYYTTAIWESYHYTSAHLPHVTVCVLYTIYKGLASQQSTKVNSMKSAVVSLVLLQGD